MLTKEVSLEKVLSLRKKDPFFTKTGELKLSMIIFRNKMLLVD